MVKDTLEEEGPTEVDVDVSDESSAASTALRFRDFFLLGFDVFEALARGDGGGLTSNSKGFPSPPRGGREGGSKCVKDRPKVDEKSGLWGRGGGWKGLVDIRSWTFLFSSDTNNKNSQSSAEMVGGGERVGCVSDLMTEAGRVKGLSPGDNILPSSAASTPPCGVSAGRLSIASSPNSLESRALTPPATLAMRNLTGLALRGAKRMQGARRGSNGVREKEGWGSLLVLKQGRMCEDRSDELKVTPCPNSPRGSQVWPWL